MPKWRSPAHAFIIHRTAVARLRPCAVPFNICGAKNRPNWLTGGAAVRRAGGRACSQHHLRDVYMVDGFGHECAVGLLNALDAFNRNQRGMGRAFSWPADRIL